MSPQHPIESLNFNSIVEAYRACDFQRVIAESESAIKIIEASNMPPPQGLYSLYALSLLNLGEVVKSVNALEKEAAIAPESTIVKKFFPVAKQLHAMQLGGRTNNATSFSSTVEGVALASKLINLTRAPAYKKFAATLLESLGKNATRYREGFDMRAPWIDLLTIALWVVDFSHPFRVLLVGDDVTLFTDIMKKASPFSEITSVAGPDIVKTFTDTVNAREAKTKNFDLIVLDIIDSHRCSMEILSRALPFVAPSGLLVGQDRARALNLTAWDSLLVNNRDSLFCYGDEGYFAIAKSPMNLLLAILN